MVKILLTTGKMIIKICIFIKHKNKKLVKTENATKHTFYTIFVEQFKFALEMW